MAFDTYGHAADLSLECGFDPFNVVIRFSSNFRLLASMTYADRDRIGPTRMRFDCRSPAFGNAYPSSGPFQMFVIVSAVRIASDELPWPFEAS